jgi:hypothetical protein
MLGITIMDPGSMVAYSRIIYALTGLSTPANDIHDIVVMML